MTPTPTPIPWYGYGGGFAASQVSLVELLLAFTGPVLVLALFVAFVWWQDTRRLRSLALPPALPLARRSSEAGGLTDREHEALQALATRLAREEPVLARMLQTLEVPHVAGGRDDPTPRRGDDV